MNVTLDTITYTALHDAFHDAPRGRPVNRGHMAVTIEDDDSEHLLRHQRDGETLPQTIMRIASGAGAT